MIKNAKKRRPHILLPSTQKFGFVNEWKLSGTHGSGRSRRGDQTSASLPDWRWQLGRENPDACVWKTDSPNARVLGVRYCDSFRHQLPCPTIPWCLCHLRQQRQPRRKSGEWNCIKTCPSTAVLVMQGIEWGGSPVQQPPGNAHFLPRSSGAADAIWDSTSRPGTDWYCYLFLEGL